MIEHGVADEALLAEVGRLLRPGGVFLFSTDYWPEKIDTRGIDLFGLPWRIFSRAEIDALVERAAAYDLRPSAPLGDLAAGAERPIHFAQRDYTFLFGALSRA